MEDLETGKKALDPEKVKNSVKLSGFIALILGVLVLSLIFNNILDISRDLAIFIGISSLIFILPSIFIIWKPLKSKIPLVLLFILYVLTIINTFNNKDFAFAIIYIFLALQVHVAIKNLNQWNAPPEKNEIIPNETPQQNVEIKKNNALPLMKKLVWIAVLTIPLIIVVGILLGPPSVQNLDQLKFPEHGAYSDKNLESTKTDTEVWSNSKYSISDKNTKYESADNHYSFILPEGWEEIPKDVIDDYQKLSSKQLGFQLPFYNAAFQPIGQNYFDYPYFFIQETNRNNETFKETLLSLKDQGLMIKVKDEFKKKFKEIFSDIKLGEAIVDEDNYKIFLVFEAKTTTGPIKALGVMNFGHDLIVNLFFYSTTEEYDKLFIDFQKTASSFEFEKDYQYKK